MIMPYHQGTACTAAKVVSCSLSKLRPAWIQKEYQFLSGGQEAGPVKNHQS